MTIVNASVQNNVREIAHMGGKMQTEFRHEKRFEEMLACPTCGKKISPRNGRLPMNKHRS